MTILTVSDVSLSFGDKSILKGISFSVNEGDKLGIIGVNGVGKTSLFKVITGEYTPDCGNVFLAKGKSIGLLSQNVIISDRDADKTALEYMYDAFPELQSSELRLEELQFEIEAEGDAERHNSLIQKFHEENENFIKNGGLEYKSRCKGMLLRLGFDESRFYDKVSCFSGGQHTRLSLAVLLAKEPDILLLDEPTNHLDIDSLSWLEGFISSYKKTVLVISHDRYFLDATTRKTLDIRYGSAILYNGGYTACKEQLSANAASLEKRYKEQEKVIARIKANIAFQRSCGREHNFVTIRAKQKQLDRMEKIELSPAEEKSIRISFAEEASTSNEVLRVKNLSFSYGGMPVIRNLSLLVRKGERVLILGKNGCGKSTLIKLMTGKLVPDKGYTELGYNIKVGYFDQENTFFDVNRTVFEEMREAYPAKTNEELRSALALFLFGSDDIEKKISDLSGGERARITLAKLMLKKVNLLIMDEPTNHLDINSREALELALEEFEGTVIAVSHDRYFINSAATRIVELTPVGVSENDSISNDVTFENAGNSYFEYRKITEENKGDAEHSVPKAISEGRQSYEEMKQKQSLERQAANKIKRAQKEIESLEAEEETLKSELFGEAASNYVRAAEIDKRISEIEERLLMLYEIVM